MMKPVEKPRLLAGLDIGTTKVTCIIGQTTESGIDVIGVGTAPNFGMKQGVVVNIEAAVESITKARDEAELMSGSKIENVWLGIGGAHVQSFDSHGMVAIRNKEVADEDILRVIEAAKAVAIPNDRQVLHVLPKDYKIDGQEGIASPIGMSGVRLETSVHIVTGSNSAVQNAIKCTQTTGLKVEGLVLQQLASALSVLSVDERSLGVCVVDMGGGTCDMISFSNGSVVHTAVIPVGGQNFTHDVAMGLRTTQVNAEQIKKKFGCALSDMVNESESIEVESVGGRKSRTLNRRELCEVLEARADETLRLIKSELEKSNLMKSLGSGLVLSGGASQLAGLSEMGDFIFDIPVRKGIPEKVGGLMDIIKSPQHSTAFGLLLYGQSQSKEKSPASSDDEDWKSQVTSWTKRFKDYLGLNQ